MSSFIRPFDRGTSATLGVVVVVGLLFVGTHLALDAVSRHAERNLGAYLWKQDDFLRLFSPAHHDEQGRGRLMIFGPSEAREALLPEELGHRLRHLKPYQGATSWGTLEELLVTLDYLEKAYGTDAIPEVLLIGITPRFIADIRDGSERFFRGIDGYSPHFKVTGDDHPPALVPKSFFDQFTALIRITALQPDRYRRGLFAVLNARFGSDWSILSSNERAMIRPGKYREVPADRLWAEKAITFDRWRRVHAWNPEETRGIIEREIGLLLGFANRHRVRLYVVNLPEHSVNRERFQPGRYAAYLDITRRAFKKTPFIDLRESLGDTNFYDEAHVTWQGARKVADTVATFITECENGRRVAQR